ncbi:hypothetical protein MIR68_001679 [Amoeboaphelidium protococcarum]|nr:hypothetical protein MIR68_001679 [Amoeboaphelidium protococcarum]
MLDQDIWIRYVYTAVCLPLTTVALIAVMACAAAINVIRLYDDETQYITFVLTSILTQLGIVNMFISAYAFGMAYQYVTSWRRRWKLYVKEFVGYYVFLALISYSAYLDVLPRAWLFTLHSTVAAIYIYLIRPLIFRPDFVEAEHNPMLALFEHDEFCCRNETPLFRLSAGHDHFRQQSQRKTRDGATDSGYTRQFLSFIKSRLRLPKSFSGIERAILGMVIVKVLTSWTVYVWSIDLSAVLLFPISIAAWFMWLEREQHFYRDFSYTWFLLIMPEFYLNILASIYFQTNSFITAGDTSNQIAVLIVYEMLVSIVSKIFYHLVLNVASQKEQAPVLLFPVYLYQYLIQFFLLLSVKEFRSPTFWISVSIAVAFNIIDITGAATEIFMQVQKKLRKDDVGIQLGFYGRGDQQEVKSMGVKNDITGAQRVIKSSRLDSDSTETVVDQSYDEEADKDDIAGYYLKKSYTYALITMQVKSVSILIAGLIGASISFMDLRSLYLLNLISKLPFDLKGTACVYLCNHLDQSLTERIIVIVVSYIIIASIAIALCIFKMSKRYNGAQSFPQIKNSSDGKNTAERLKIQLLQNALEVICLSKGHLSRQFGNGKHLLYFVCVITHASWSFLSYLQQR